MVRVVILDVLVTVMLFGASLLILRWKKDLNKSAYTLTRNIGIGIGVMAFRDVTNILYQVITQSELNIFYSLIPELLGVLIIMFSMFTYLEVKLK